MKSIYLFYERDCCGDEQLKGAYASKELAIKEMRDYIDYLEQDAKEYLGGIRLEAELLRLQVVRESLKIVADYGKEQYPYSYYEDQGFILTKKDLIENEEDLKRENKKSEVELEF